jgi:hypothetical protein
MPRFRIPAIALIGAAATGWAGLAQACPGVGVITRIEGRAQDVVIRRTEAGTTSTVARPRVLEVICKGDTVTVAGATFVVLSIEGAAPVTINHSAAYTVAEPGSSDRALGNAYGVLSDQLVPDMKRLPWTVRLKGPGDDFGFAVPDLTAGGQQVEVSDRALLVRLVGGTAPYKVELRDANNAVVAVQTSRTHEVVLPRVTLSPGAYRLTASDSTPRSLDAAIVAVAAPPPSDAAFDGLADPEVRAAAKAAALAREAPALWSFQAEQELQAAPAHGLERDAVYELIESYGAD